MSEPVWLTNLASTSSSNFMTESTVLRVHMFHPVVDSPSPETARIENDSLHQTKTYANGFIPFEALYWRCQRCIEVPAAGHRIYVAKVSGTDELEKHPEEAWIVTPQCRENSLFY